VGSLCGWAPWLSHQVALLQCNPASWMRERSEKWRKNLGTFYRLDRDSRWILMENYDK
jgi:hypothetical protein